MILKSGNWDYNLYNIPLEISVKDSKGAEIFVKQFQNNASGFNEVTFSTKQYSSGLHECSRGSASLPSSHGRGIRPQNALKKDS